MPLIVQNIFGYGITLVGVITVGHLGTYELSAAILGSSAMNITGFAFLVRHEPSFSPAQYMYSCPEQARMFVLMLQLLCNVCSCYVTCD